MFDLHLHSCFSDDCKTSLEDIIKFASQNNLLGLAFTDHYEFENFDRKYKFQFDIPKRADLIIKLQESIGDKLQLLHGVELGIEPHKLLEAEALVSQNYFDCVIASVHNIEKNDFRLNSFKGKDQSEVFRRYLQEVLFSISNFKDYDIVGHVGVICRYVPIKYSTVFQAEFASLIDQILLQIINDKKALEVNTSGIRQNLGFTLPDSIILKRYFDLGGRLITLGSDAHIAEHVGADFVTVSKALKDIGFTQAVYFKNRKLIFYDL